jgi:hypothetical protein
MAYDPAGDGIVLLDRDGVASLGGQVVFGEDDGCAGARREFPHEAVVGMGVAEDPAGAVDVEDDRQGASGAGRLDDPRPDRVGRATVDGDPLLVDVRLGDLTDWTSSTALRPSTGPRSNR